MRVRRASAPAQGSQSLWDRFLIAKLEQQAREIGRNPFGSGTGF